MKLVHIIYFSMHEVFPAMYTKSAHDHYSPCKEFLTVLVVLGALEVLPFLILLSYLIFHCFLLDLTLPVQHLTNAVDLTLILKREL